ncbi:hypothetical protein [Agrococcus carbonis]|uniref:Uncharacterized protein n=1 Tax=Agrococcus carbonis TaxID=684552 RepID=A0A1H1LQS5_9MICO|nr:hypothetical protein [Agrococcus carbonis]SDR76700.1 hypothetical protein SAMN04489719_0706 [Agrococcus carbonis]
MTDEIPKHTPSTHRHHSAAHDADVVTGGAHSGAHVQQPTVGEDAKENPAEGWDADAPGQG